MEKHFPKKTDMFHQIILKNAFLTYVVFLYYILCYITQIDLSDESEFSFFGVSFHFGDRFWGHCPRRAA